MNSILMALVILAFTLDSTTAKPNEKMTVEEGIAFCTAANAVLSIKEKDSELHHIFVEEGKWWYNKGKLLSREKNFVSLVENTMHAFNTALEANAITWKEIYKGSYNCIKIRAELEE